MLSSRASDLDHGQAGIAGEEAVAAWLGSMPESDDLAIIVRQTNSTLKKLFATGKGAQTSGLITGMIAAVRNLMMVADHGQPPVELINSLYFTGKERPLRADVVTLFRKHPLPRFLLLACGEHRSMLSDPGSMFNDCD